MGKRNERYRLENMVAYNEAFAGKAKKSLKRGGGRKKRAVVAVMADSTLLENP